MDFFNWEDILIVSMALVHHPLLSRPHVKNWFNSWGPPENLVSEALGWYPDSRSFSHSKSGDVGCGELSDLGGLSVTLA